MNSESILSVQNLHVNYGGIRALRGVSLDVNEGEIITLVGANGAGKSTLMNSIMGLVSKAQFIIKVKILQLRRRQRLSRKESSCLRKGVTSFQPLLFVTIL